MNNSIFFWILLFIIISGIISVLLVVFYNLMAQKEESVNETFAQIKNFYAKKQDLIPVIIAIIKNYTDYEGETLDKLNGIVKMYPELKANSNFLELQSQLEYTENEIVKARTLYNEKVKDFNSYIKSFPQNFVAFISGVKTKEYFDAEMLEEGV